MSRFASPARRIAPGMLAIAALAIAALALAGCAGSGPSAAPATSLPAGVIAVEAKDYAFVPPTLAAPAGAVTFSVKNTSGQDHQFEIFNGETLVDGVLGIGGGQSKDLTVTLAAGSYTYICTLNGHDQLGMKGTLTVQ